MDKYLIIIKNLGRRKVNMTFNEVLEDQVEQVMLNFCKQHLISDNILFMTNGDIVAGFHKVGSYELKKIFS